MLSWECILVLDLIWAPLALVEVVAGTWHLARFELARADIELALVSFLALLLLVVVAWPHVGSSSLAHADGVLEHWMFPVESLIHCAKNKLE